MLQGECVSRLECWRILIVGKQYKEEELEKGRERM